MGLDETYDTVTKGANPAIACACDQLPLLMQLNVLRDACRLVEPGAYTCELRVLRIALAHKPADVSVHVVVSSRTVDCAQLTGAPIDCSRRAAPELAGSPQPMDNAGWPMTVANWMAMAVVTGAVQPAPAGCERQKKMEREKEGQCGKA